MAGERRARRAARKASKVDMSAVENQEKARFTPRQATIFRDPFAPEWHSLVHDDPDKGVLMLHQGQPAEARHALTAYSVMNGFGTPRDHSEGVPIDPMLRDRYEVAVKHLANQRMNVGDWRNDIPPFEEARNRAEIVRSAGHEPRTPVDALLNMERVISEKTRQLNELVRTADVQEDITKIIQLRTEIVGLRTVAESYRNNIAPDEVRNAYGTRISSLREALTGQREELNIAQEMLAGDPTNPELIALYLEKGQEVINTHNEIQVLRTSAGLPAEETVEFDPGQMLIDARDNNDYAPPEDVTPQMREYGMKPQGEPEPEYIPQDSVEVELSETYIRDQGYDLDEIEYGIARRSGEWADERYGPTPEWTPDNALPRERQEHPDLVEHRLNRDPEDPGQSVERPGPPPTDSPGGASIDPRNAHIDEQLANHPVTNGDIGLHYDLGLPSEAPPRVPDDPITRPEPRDHLAHADHLDRQAANSAEPDALRNAANLVRHFTPVESGSAPTTLPRSPSKPSARASVSKGRGLRR